MTNRAIYNKKYYQNMRGGEDYSSNMVSTFYDSFLSHSKVNVKGLTVLDVGCGRGELIRLLVEKGAARVYGVDFSEDSMAISRGFLERCKIDQSSYRLAHLDITKYDEQLKEKFDLVFMLDVVEHLCPVDLEKALKNCFFYLNEGGKIFFHTFPTRLPHKIFLALYSILKPSLKRETECIHVNVQNRSSIISVFEDCGFKVGSLRLENDLLLASSFYQRLNNGLLKKALQNIFNDVPSFALVRKLSRIVGLEEMFYMSIYGIAKKDFKNAKKQ